MATGLPENCKLCIDTVSVHVFRYPERDEDDDVWLSTSLPQEQGRDDLVTFLLVKPTRPLR